MIQNIKKNGWISMDLLNELLTKRKYLDATIVSLRKRASEYAEAYRNYRVMLSKELIRLKDEGMAVTLAYDVARGKEEIALAKFEEIVKEGEYKADMELINSIKLQIRLIENQLQREYTNEGKTSL